jgi:uncharacterized protein
MTTNKYGDSAYFDREFSTEQRQNLAKSGAAMPGGGFPIKSEQDLKNAIRAIGRAKDPAAAKAHIKKRAKALGLTKLLPDTWDAAPADCADCKGTGDCATCAGTGMVDGEDCADCAGTGDCATCDGTGEVKKTNDAKNPMVSCPSCDGTGENDSGGDCSTCGGSGKVPKGTKSKDARPEFVHSYDALLEFDDKAKLRLARDGYLIASPRIARTGIQIYKGVELGISDVDEIRVYRPAAEVFSKDSIRSFSNRPVTLEHPGEMVDASNWDKHAIGHTGDEIMRDGEFIRIPMMVMDQEAIDAIRKGQRQLSVGYSADLEWKAGITDSGEAYDAVQRNIRANHLAVVASARGGSKLVIGDTRDGDSEGDGNMPTKTIVVDSVSLEISDTAASVIQRALKVRDDANEAFEAEIEELKAELKKIGVQFDTDKKALDTAVQTKDGEIAVLKKKIEDGKITPAMLDEAVKMRVGVVDRARKILGDKLVIDGKTDDDIRRQVVAVVLSPEQAKSMTEDQILGAFLAGTHGDSKGNGSNGSGDRLRKHLSSNDGHAHSSGDAREKAWNDMNARTQNAWKGEQTKQ